MLREGEGDKLGMKVGVWLHISQVKRYSRSKSDIPNQQVLVDPTNMFERPIVAISHICVHFSHSTCDQAQALNSEYCYLLWL